MRISFVLVKIVKTFMFFLQFPLRLDEEYEDSEEEEENPDASNLLVDIDLDLSAQVKRVSHSLRY